MGLARNDKMAMMNWIKCTSVDCDLFQRSTLNVQHSTFNQYPVVLSEAKHLCPEIVRFAQNDSFDTAHRTLKAKRLARRRLAEGGLNVHGCRR